MERFSDRYRTYSKLLNREKPALFWAFRQRVVVIPDRLFRITHRSRNVGKELKLLSV